MRRLIPSPSMGVAVLALLVALAGTGYAALKLPAGSVGTRQLKAHAVTAGRLHTGAVTASRLHQGAVGTAALRDGAVTSAKVRDGSLTASDLAAGTLLRGPAGAAGSSLAYAHVDDFAQLVPNQNKGVANANITKGDGAGTFCFTGLPYIPHNATVNADSEDLGFIATVDIPHSPAASSECPATTQIEVTLYDQAHVERKGGFYITIN